MIASDPIKISTQNPCKWGSSTYDSLRPAMEALMRGQFSDQGRMFSYLSPEERVPKGHPLRAVRAMVRAVLEELHGDFAKLYSSDGRPSIPPEQLLSALLLQVFYGIRSERQLMEQLDYNLLYRWPRLACQPH